MTVNIKKIKSDIKTHVLYSNASWSGYMHRSAILIAACIVIWFLNVDIWKNLKNDHARNWVVEQAFAYEDVRKAPESGDEAPTKDDGKDGVLVGGIPSLIEETFGEHAERATRIFRCESGLNPKKHSGVDVTADGRPFSVGLAQINLTVTGVGDLDCPKAFSGRNYQATVVNEKLYNQCVKAAEDPKTSLAIAKKKFDARGNFGAWLNCANKNK